MFPHPFSMSDVEFPTLIAGSRFDSWVMRGTEITPFYDSLIVKILQWDRNRGKCIETLLKSMSQTKLTGTTNLLDFLTQFVATEDVTISFRCLMKRNHFSIFPMT